MGPQDLRDGQPLRPKLLERVRDAIRLRHYSYRTEETYVHWIKRTGPGQQLGLTAYSQTWNTCGRAAGSLCSR